MHRRSLDARVTSAEDGAIVTGPNVMPAPRQSAIRRLQKEAILFGALFFGGLLLLPLAIYGVGKAVFGSYGGGDFFDFFVTLQGRLWSGEPAVLFLMLSPYLLWQLLRLTFVAMRRQAG